MDSISLNIDDSVARKLEDRQILHADIIEVLLHAEDAGAQFYNTNTGHSLASLRPRQITFWVEYRKETDGSYSIYDAYSHRLVVPGVPGEGRLGPSLFDEYPLKGGRM